MRQKELQINYHTAPNGLRMVHVSLPRSAVGYMGVTVRVGSRDEDDASLGLAHFVEHTIFKGTRRRSSWHIINRMEAVGGELNAYTTKEETVLYSVFPSGNLARAAELVADLACNSQFPAKELDKEREVVGDEIDSYLDSPSEAVYDDFEDLLFAGSSIGHNILGSRKALEKFDPQVCRNYLARWYVPGNMVVFYAGNVGADTVFAIMERSFASLSGDVPATQRLLPVTVATFDVHKAVDTHQCHTIMGARIGGMSAPDRFANALLTNILGGPGMNSLLNVNLRERNGLVYNVEASTGIFSDCGLLTIYYGCDPDDNDRCRRLVENTVASIAEGAITPRRFEMYKKQYLGQLIVASENLESRVLGIARQTLFHGKASTAVRTIEAIKAVALSELSAAAQSLSPLSKLTFGK